MPVTSFLIALFAMGQVGVASPQTIPAATNTPALQSCAPGQMSVTGFVKDQAGTPVPGAIVTIVNLDSGARLIVGTGHSREPSTGADIGKYCSGTIAPGRYSITIEKSGFLRQFEGEVDLRKRTQSQALDFVLYREVAPARGNELFALIGGVFLYLASIWLVRWYNVAWPARGPLQARLTTLKERVNHEPDTDTRQHAEDLLQIVDEEIRRQSKGWRFIDFLFWSRGQEQQA
jgi:hypothetical protein